MIDFYQGIKLAVWMISLCLIAVRIIDWKHGKGNKVAHIGSIFFAAGPLIGLSLSFLFKVKASSINEAMVWSLGFAIFYIGAAIRISESGTDRVRSGINFVLVLMICMMAGYLL